VVARERGGRREEKARLTQQLQLPGGRSDVRERSTTVAMHLLRRLLRDL
jgi:nicotinamide-nucleotide amidase